MTDKSEPAFPIPNATDLDGYVFAPHASGLTKREYFAAMAMQSLIMNGFYDLDQIGMLAEESSKIADTLIEELNK